MNEHGAGVSEDELVATFDRLDAGPDAPFSSMKSAKDGAGNPQKKTLRGS